MESTDNRNLIETIIASQAASGNVRPIPNVQPATGDGAATIGLGFPPETFVAKEAGGIPPSGQDMNGFLNLLSSAIQNLQANNMGIYSADLAQAIGGYPLNAVVSSGTNGAFWVSTAENNMTVPGASGASWANLFAGLALIAGNSNQNFAANALQANSVTSAGGYSFNSTSFPFIYTDAENNLNIRTGSQNSGCYYQFDGAGNFKILTGNVAMGNGAYFYALSNGGIGMRVNSPNDYNYFIFNSDGTLQVNTPAPNFSGVPNLGQICGLFSVSSDSILWNIPNGQNANLTTVLTNTIQMGKVLVPSSGSWLAFPHAFPNRCLSIVATDGGDAAYSYGFANVTQYGCNVYYNSPSGNNTEAGFDIIAIGN